MVTSIEFPGVDELRTNLRIMLTSAVFGPEVADELCIRFWEILVQLASRLSGEGSH
jgi:hypothetical protein